MNLSQLEILVAIVDTGSLTEAAEVVSLTQSAVSHSLNKLEAELGVTLLERGRQGITVTQIGQEVLQHARTILSQTEVIRQKTARERGLAIGKLRFGTVPTIPARLLTGMLREYQQKYPDIDLVVFEGTPEELVEWLDNGVIDVGSVVIPDDYPASVPLAHNEIKVIVSVDHPLASQTSITMNRLLDETFIGPKTGYGALTSLSSFERVFNSPSRFEVSTFNTILAMVRENMGISMLPEMLIDPNTDGIVKLSFDPKLSIQIYLATRVQSPVTDSFLSTASAWAKEHHFFTEEI